MKKRYSLYLAGSIKLWKKEFKKKYSVFFNQKAKLFEPGKFNIPDDHRRIVRRIAQVDRIEIVKSDAVIAYMKDYKSFKFGGPAGTDSSWECGYAFGIKKPVIAIIEDFEQLSYFERQWMLTYNVKAFLTSQKGVVKAMNKSKHFNHAKILFSDSPKFFEEKIIEYLDNLYKN